MIILHRIGVYATTACIAGIFAFFLYAQPAVAWNALWILGLIALGLQGRLLGFEYKMPAFWIFLLTPFYLLATSIFFYLFLEGDSARMILALFTVGGIWIYLENLFTFYHLPGSYQAYALEYLSLALYIGSVFFFASGAYAAQLFLLLPVWVPALAVFWVMLGTSISVFWVSKVTLEVSIKYAVAGAICLTQLYIALAYLPTSFLLNATAFAVMYYVFLGLARAHVLHKLNNTVLVRYAGAGAAFLVLLFTTATWN